ncbi:MAG TPA: hypothetical protein VGH67_06745 [Solirubrobacteraceae bacterium]
MAQQRTPSIQTCLSQDLVEPVAERVGRAADENVVQRIWAGDASLWERAAAAEADAGLGWLTLPETMRAQAPLLRSFAQECWADGFTDAVVLATGGAALGAEVIRRTLAPAGDGLTVRVLDTTHPDAVLAVEESLDLARTLFVVSAKSGETVETVSHYKHFSALAPPERFVAVTDPGSSLAGLALRQGFRRLFLNPPHIAERHSVLSVSGLLPAALMGVDIDALLGSAQAGAEECAQYAAGNDNPGLWLGAVAGELASAGRDKLTFVVPPPIDSFGLWVEQLIATSCARRGRGIIPVADEPFAAPEAYASDRVITYVRSTDEPLGDFDEEVQRLADAGQPTLTVPSSGTADLGRLVFVSQFAAAVAAWATGVNPFEGPASGSLDATRRALESGAPAQVPRASDEDLRALLAGAGPPSYVAVLGFLPPSDRVDEAVAELRGVIRSAIRTAVTFGYGPRYLHATGQLHKGGPPRGRFLQLIARPRRDAEIPGAGYSYARLVTAQAAGDHQALRAHGLPVVPVELEGDAATAVRKLTERVSGLLGT